MDSTRAGALEQKFRDGLQQHSFQSFIEEAQNIRRTEGEQTLRQNLRNLHYGEVRDIDTDSSLIFQAGSRLYKLGPEGQVRSSKSARDAALEESHSGLAAATPSEIVGMKINPLRPPGLADLAPGREKNASSTALDILDFRAKEGTLQTKNRTVTGVQNHGSIRQFTYQGTLDTDSYVPPRGLITGARADGDRIASKPNNFKGRETVDSAGNLLSFEVEYQRSTATSAVSQNGWGWAPRTEAFYPSAVVGNHSAQSISRIQGKHNDKTDLYDVEIVDSSGGTKHFEADKTGKIISSRSATGICDPNALTSLDDRRYVLDSAGRIIGIDSLQISYDNKGNATRLKGPGLGEYVRNNTNKWTITKPDGTQLSYTGEISVDIAGSVVFKNANGQKIIYSDGQIEEFDSQHRIRRTTTRDSATDYTWKDGGVTEQRTVTSDGTETIVRSQSVQKPSTRGLNLDTRLRSSCEL